MKMNKHEMIDQEDKMYYIYEIEMPEEYMEELRKIAETEHMSLEEMTARGLAHMAAHPEDTKAWKAEFDALPDDKKDKMNRIRLVRTYPVHDGETESDARKMAIWREEQQNLCLHEVSQKEFCEHIEDDDFFLTYGNPVVINCDNGHRLVCMAWPMAERILRMTGRGDEADEVIRKAAEMQDKNGE